MPTIQATTIGGKIIPRASWKVKSLGSISHGEVVRVNVPFEDDKLAKYLTKTQAPECSLEREEDGGTSVTIGLVVEKFTHLLDDGAEEPDIESMAWLKPLNRAVEAVLQYMMDRGNCDSKFLAAVGTKRREEEEGSADA